MPSHNGMFIVNKHQAGGGNVYLYLPVFYHTFSFRRAHLLLVYTD